TSACDLDHAERRAMTYHGNLLHGRLHMLRNLDDLRQLRIAGHDSLEEIAEGKFNLAIDQVIDIEFVDPVGFFQLPCSGTAHDNLRLVLLDDRMRDNAYELRRV